jgi:hypothetical protein
MITSFIIHDPSECPLPAAAGLSDLEVGMPFAHNLQNKDEWNLTGSVKRNHGSARSCQFFSAQSRTGMPGPIRQRLRTDC